MNLMTIREAAALLKCSRTAVYERMKEPGFPPSAKLGKRRFLESESLEAWLRAQFTERETTERLDAAA